LVVGEGGEEEGLAERDGRGFGGERGGHFEEDVEVVRGPFEDRLEAFDGLTESTEGEGKSVS
jgi:hypothetical protein